MKKILSLVLALVMMLGCSAVGAEEEAPELPELYRSDFTLENADGWYGNNCTGEVVDDGAAYAVSGRTLGWQAPNRVFPLKPGVEYKVSVQVYQEAMDVANFMISAAQDGANWVNIVAAEVPKGEWTTIEGVFTPGEFSEFILYVETDDDAKTIDFKICEFVICGPEDGLA